MAAVQEGKREARVDSRICGRQDRERKKKNRTSGCHAALTKEVSADIFVCLDFKYTPKKSHVFGSYLRALMITLSEDVWPATTMEGLRGQLFNKRPASRKQCR